MYLLLPKNKCLIDKKIFSEEAGEIIFKSFSDIFPLYQEHIIHQDLKNYKLN